MKNWKDLLPYYLPASDTAPAGATAALGDDIERILDDVVTHARTNDPRGDVLVELAVLKLLDLRASNPGGYARAREDLMSMFG